LALEVQPATRAAALARMAKFMAAGFMAFCAKVKAAGDAG
jgi:hypothetical protein